MKLDKSRFIFPLILFLICLFFYWPVFLQNKIAFPGDMLVGAYYPWLEYKWGYTTGVPVKNPYITDIFSQIYPWKKMIGESYRNGQIPLWNPYSLSGYPLLANYQAGALNPFNLFFIIHNQSLALNLYLISGSLLLAFSMYFLCCELFSSRISALIASIVSTFTGFSILWMPYANANFSQAAIILSLLTIYKFQKTNKFRYLLFLVPSLSFLVFSGHLQLLIFGSILILSFLLFNFPQKIHFSFKWLLPFILALIITAPQWLSTIELYSHSIRNQDNFIEKFNFGLSSISKLVTLISPDFFGNPSTYNYWGNFNYHETCIYFSLIGLISLLYFMVKRSTNKIIKFFVWTTLISLFFTLDSPITKILYKINFPLLFSSVPGRISGILLISSGILVAALISGIEKRKIKALSLFKSSFCLISLIGILAAICLYIIKSHLSMESQANIALRNLFYPTLILIPLLLALLFSTKNKKYLFLVLVLVIFDSFRFTTKNTPFVKSEFLFPTTPSLEKIKSDPEIFRIVAEKGEILPPNTWSAYHQLSPEGYDPLTPLSYAYQFNHYLNEYPGNGVSRYLELYNFNAPKLGEYSVKYLFAIKRNADGSLKGNQLRINYKTQDWEKFYETPETIILKNKYYQPISNYQISSWQAGKITFDLQNEATDSALIYRENYYPGWQATADGKSLPIEKNEQGFIKIKLDSKYDQLTLQFFPDYIKYLFYLSTFTAIICLLILLYSIKHES